MSEGADKIFSGDWYRQILETAPDPMLVVGRDGRIVFVNTQAEKTFGYTVAQLLGQSLDFLIPERFHGAHVGHLRRYFANPGTRPMGSGLELFGRRADGSELAIEVSLSPVGSGDALMVSAAIRDITDRKRMEAETKLSADRLASAVDSIQDAFALFDDADRLVLCNSTYRRLIGEVLPGPLVGRPYRELLEAWIHQIDFGADDAGRRFREERLDRRRLDATTTFDIRLRDGRSLRVMDRRTPEGGIVKTIWDLTEDEQRAVELREARAAAEAGSSAKSEFLSSMSHELRTPLNAILGFAQLLRRDQKEPLSERHKERVDHILKGGEHLLRLIDDILDLSRIEAGAISISNEPVDVGEVVAEVVRALEPMAARHALRVRVEPIAEAVAMVEADRTRLMQVLMNFGSNAIKYNRPEGTVTFVVTAQGGRARIAVRDTGYGIPADKQDKLFQPFQRAGQETGPIEGTGIGLVISKRLAALMNGDVGFESGPDGSAFWLDLPVHQRRVVAGRAMPSREPRAPASAGHAQREILYVEDNPANVAFMRDLVSAFDKVTLLVAPTAEMGVELARARHPSLILMDINLPGMSGVDALRELRAIPETAGIPIVALTAAASPRDKEQGMREGFHGYLTKPVKVDELMTVIDGLLEAER